jgi:hypothetical protein
MFDTLSWFRFLGLSFDLLYFPRPSDVILVTRQIEPDLDACCRPGLPDGLPKRLPPSRSAGPEGAVFHPHQSIDSGPKIPYS